jgi:hypothetical protein
MAPTATPFIDLPFPARRHLDCARVEEHVCDWAGRFHLVRSDAAAWRLTRSRFGEFAACAYPTVSWPEVEVAASWLAWLFFADDQYEESAYGSERGWVSVIDAVRGVLEPGRGAGPAAGAPVPFKVQN